MRILLFYFYLQRKSSFASVEWVISLVYWKLCHLQFRQEHTRGTFSVESFRCLLLWPCNLLNVNKLIGKHSSCAPFGLSVSYVTLRLLICGLELTRAFCLSVGYVTRAFWSVCGLCHARLLVNLWAVSRAPFGLSVGCVSLVFWSVCGLCHARLFGLSVGCPARLSVCLSRVMKMFIQASGVTAFGPLCISLTKLSSPVVLRRWNMQDPTRAHLHVLWRQMNNVLRCI